MTVAPPTSGSRSVRCRPIGDRDIDAVVNLLARGFPHQGRALWRSGIERHLSGPIPEGCPRLGFVLESDARAVGVILTLYTRLEAQGRVTLRCNMSSWYVEPDYRAYAALLDNVAIRMKGVTYFNISAAPHTWPMHEARGFARYCVGQFVAVPLLGPSRPGARLRAVHPGDSLEDLPEPERRLMADHARFGCVCLVGSDARGSEPFVFVRRPVASLRRRLGWSPLSFFQLVYCRSTHELARFAHPIGRHLLVRHAMPLIVIDGVEPIAGLPGRAVPEWGTKFSRGPDAIRLGDLAYTELVLFGS